MHIKNLLNILYHIIHHTLGLLFPPDCVVCKKSGSTLCLSCAATIRPIPAPFCQHCNTPLSTPDYCKRCSSKPLHINGLCAAGIYEGSLRLCIYALKYNGQTQLVTPLGSLLVRTYHQRGLQADIIVPVPLHEERQRKRGYNQAHLLAELCARELQLPLVTTLLIRVRATSTQAALPASERPQNVIGAFQCLSKPLCEGKKILIIDDVYTTGSTLEACAAPLFLSGASEVWGLVLARVL